MHFFTEWNQWSRMKIIITVLEFTMLPTYVPTIPALGYMRAVLMMYFISPDTDSKQILTDLVDAVINDLGPYVQMSYDIQTIQFSCMQHPLLDFKVSFCCMYSS